PPIHLSTTYRFPGFEKPGPYDYSRTANPTRDLLADTLAQLEGGAGAVVTATGMAAVSLLLATLDPGDLVVAPHDCYGGTHRLLSMRAAKGHFDVAFVNLNEAAGFAEA
ncbi:PLP-dependent transferase, partial [Azospirillum argentinense]